jgi:hypothetical protein
LNDVVITELTQIIVVEKKVWVRVLGESLGRETREDFSCGIFTFPEISVDFSAD